MVYGLEVSSCNPLMWIKRAILFFKEIIHVECNTSINVRITDNCLAFLC